MSTQQEVGPVPSETDPATPAQPVAPIPFKGAHKAWAIVGIIALSLTFFPIGLVLGIVLIFVSEHRYRTVGIVGTAVGFVVTVITGMFYFLLLNVVPMALNNAAVAPVAPETTVSAQPSPAAPSVAVVAPTPEISATNPVATDPVQSVASSTKELIGKIEAYRFEALKTSDLSLLDKYYPSHQDVGWQDDRTAIVTHKNAGLNSTAITGIEVYTVSSSKIVARVTRKYVFADSGKMTTEVDSSNNTYEVVSGRWYLTSFK